MIYGYDRHMKVIKRGSIVRFIDRHTANQRVGHVWFCEMDGFGWMVSFNHTFSESGQPIEDGYGYRVIGNVDINPDDEKLLDLDVKNSSVCQTSGWGDDVTWTPYPHWTR